MINPYNEFRKKAEVLYYRDCKNYLQKIPYFVNSYYRPDYVEVIRISSSGTISGSLMGTDLMNKILIPVYNSSFHFLSSDCASAVYTETGGSLSVDLRDTVGQWFLGYPFSFGQRIFYSDNYMDCFEFLFNTMITNSSLLNQNSLHVARLVSIGDWYLDGAMYKRKLTYDFFNNTGVLIEQFKSCCENLDYSPIVRLLGGQ